MEFGDVVDVMVLMGDFILDFFDCCLVVLIVVGIGIMFLMSMLVIVVYEELICEFLLFFVVCNGCEYVFCNEICDLVVGYEYFKFVVYYL